MLYDLTLPISPSMVTWPGDPPVRVEQRVSIARGDACNVSELSMGSHTGTHLDAPYHFVEGGQRLDALPLDLLMGKAWVLDCGSRPRVDVDDLTQVPAGAQRLLLKTANSELWRRGAREFRCEFVTITLEAARWIVGQGVRLLGVDYLSVERPGSKDHRVHHTLLGAGLVVVEGLDLAAIEQGWYNLVCLPLKLAGGDGAPARVVAIGPLPARQRRRKHGDTEDTENGQRKT